MPDSNAFLQNSLLFARSEEHTSELQSRLHLVCRLLLEKKKIHHHNYDQRFPSDQYLHKNTQIKFNINMYRHLPTTRASLQTSRDNTDSESITPQRSTH